MKKDLIIFHKKKRNENFFHETNFQFMKKK